MTNTAAPARSTASIVAELAQVSRHRAELVTQIAYLEGMNLGSSANALRDVADTFAYRYGVLESELVKTTNARTENQDAVDRFGAFPIRVEDGVLDQPLGAGEMFSLYTDREGRPYATRGDKSIRVRFGHSTTRVDYSY